MTVYNRYNGAWYSKVLSGCYFGPVRGETLNDTTVSINDNLICRIPESSAFTEQYTGQADTFTLAPGDIVVQGAVNDVIEDVKGKRVSDLLEKYKGKAFKIETVSINTALDCGKHYKVTG